MQESIINLINESVRTFTNISKDQHQVVLIENITNTILNAFKSDNKLLLCGNGGSAADAQHIAAELSGRFEIDRKPLNAEALHVNSSFVTAVANDYGYEEVYSRMVEANGKNGDILLALSTSGNSKNVIRAIDKANSKGLITIGFSGNDGGAMQNLCKYNLIIPSDNTARIQEAHILVGHIICKLIEQKMFS
jgi:D-sedoheptulose 7-phosphate isomerase